MPNDCDFISLAGDIDVSRVDELWSAIEAFRESAAMHAVVDLSDVTSLGSEGLGFVAQLVEVAHRRGGRVTLINSSEAAVRVVELRGMRVLLPRERHYSIPLPRAMEADAVAVI